MSVEYIKGLHELGDGLWAYLQPRGQWGYSNAGLVVGDGDSLLVDTLFDLNLTRQMLEQMKPITGVQPWNPDRVGRPDQQLAHGPVATSIPRIRTGPHSHVGEDGRVPPAAGPLMRLVTFEVTTPSGPARRAGAIAGGEQADLGAP
jgi:hypothetical protein